MDVKQRAANKPVDTNIPDYKKNPDDYNFNYEYYVVRPDIIGKTISMVFVKKSISFADHWNCMCYSDWGCCHSFCYMTLKYYDEDDCKHDVSIPNIDNLFDTDEEMIKAIKDACKEYIGEDY